MLLLIVVTSYTLFFILDYLNVKKSQNKVQIIMYLIIFFFSFSLSLAYVFDLPLPIVSHLLRGIINK
jgi:hypothetical protein